MKTTLYVFSATGNCLTTARKAAAQLGSCMIKSVTAANRSRVVKEDAERVGFVFPVYYGDMPYPLREMLSKTVFAGDPYIFAFTTCRGHVGAAPQRLDQLLRTRGQTLSMAVNIRMPGNSFLNPPEVDQAALDAQDSSIPEVLEPVRKLEVRDYASQELLPLMPVDYPNNFRGIQADDSCIGCGTCAKICPMDNITLKDGKAQFGDACATCLACFHWCPTEAVYMSKAEDIARRRKYRHPDVRLQDILDLK